MTEEEKKEHNGISSYSTDVAGNRVTVQVQKKNKLGKELYERLEDFLDGLVVEYGHG